MARPLLYELNTRCWLRSLSDQAGKPVSLGNVPEALVREWAALGFTHIWAMGVWTTGELCRKHALQYWWPAASLQHSHLAGREEDVRGSPYAISSYQVDPKLGGATGLATFRQQLRRHGLSLILDFVPNHVAIDHHWLAERPELFVHSQVEKAETFRFSEAASPWFAHGKDPFFPAWSDTAQLDYRNPETRSTMRDLLCEIAASCDGVRCDMAMLTLTDIFEETWKHFPVEFNERGEFWPEAINAAKSRNGSFIFIAEVYWDLERRMQDLGFDFTYEKVFLDLLEARRCRELAARLRLMSVAQMERSVWFLENHDERRASERFTPDELRASVALLLLGLPGMRLIYEGQMEGRQKFLPVQLARWPEEPPKQALVEWHHQLLELRREIGISEAHFSRVDGSSPEEILVVQWTNKAGMHFLFAANISPTGKELSIPKSTMNDPSKTAYRDRISGRLMTVRAVGSAQVLELGAYETVLLVDHGNTTNL